MGRRKKDRISPTLRWLNELIQEGWPREMVLQTCEDQITPELLQKIKEGEFTKDRITEAARRHSILEYELDYLDEQLKEEVQKFLRESITAEDYTFMKEMDLSKLTTLRTVVNQCIRERLTTDALKDNPEQVKQQIRGQLCPEPVKQFEKQCLRRLEANEYGARQRIGVSTVILYRLYVVWCEVRGIGCIPQRTLTVELEKLDHRKDKGKCLVKSYVTGQAENKQPIIYHYVPGIAEINLLEQVKRKIHEKLTEREWTQDSEEYQQLHALEVWFNKEDK